MRGRKRDILVTCPVYTSSITAAAAAGLVEMRYGMDYLGLLCSKLLLAEC